MTAWRTAICARNGAREGIRTPNLLIRRFTGLLIVYDQQTKMAESTIRLIAKFNILKRFLNKTNFLSFEAKYNLGILNNNYIYAHLVFEAAKAAKNLGIKRITVIEFGVAGGNGLIQFENISTKVEKYTGVSIDVIGFDTGTGLPEVTDYRDLPYVWQRGHYPMDIQLLKSKLTKAKLVLGNISETLEKFIEDFNPAPIAAISFDLDLYSSTRDAFKLLESHEKYFLPRVLCYFDDIMGGNLELYNEYTGERLAINEFNNNSKSRKICPVTYLEKINRDYYGKNISFHSIYSFHIFNHSMYNNYLSLELGNGLELK